MTGNPNGWTAGAHHVGLTVPELAPAVRFFEEGLDFEQVGEVPDYPAVFLSDGQVLITLWQASDGNEAVAFDRHRNLGLHHLALRVGGRGLDALHARLAARKDVEIEFAPQVLGAGPTRHMMTRIPGNLRIEFIAPAT